LIQVIGGLFLYLFPMAMSSVQVDSIAGIFSILGFIIVYCAGCLAIVNTSVGMINMVPNNVLSWIGGTMINNAGEAMQRHTDSAAGNVQNTISAALRGGGNGVSGSGLKGIQTEKEA